ncbi:MAG TPA: histidine kinase [Gemmataceae bacterium]|jgi:signal transduction histidine kinase
MTDGAITTGHEEKALRDGASEFLHPTTFDFILDTQIVTDGTGIVLTANHASATLFRCRKEFLLGKPLPLFAAEGHRARLYESIWLLHQDVAIDSFETHLAHGKQEPRECHVIVRVNDEERYFPYGRRLLWLFRDMTLLNRIDSGRREALRRLTTIEEDERRRLARDLHDTVGQKLTAISLGIHAAEVAHGIPAKAVAHLRSVHGLIDELTKDMHDLATRVRPLVLDDIGFEPALRQLIVDWSKQTAIAAEFFAAGLDSRKLPGEIESTLYRVVQEGLTNVSRHAKAKKVAVVVEVSNGCLIAIVEDDGVGIDGQGNGARLGLTGMKERLALVGGTLEIESEPDRGSTLLARIPMTHQ